MDISKDPVKKLPIWIQLPNLEVKYWGEKSLSKIVSQIGTMIKVDQATHNRDKLMFAKVLVEVNIDQQFPEVIRFRSEIGRMIEQRVSYDWLPISCSICKGMGHTSNACTRRATLATQRVWRPKAVQPVAHPVAQPTPPQGGITQAARFSKQKSQQLKPFYTANKYQLLSEVDVEFDNGEIPNGEENQFQRSPVGRGWQPLSLMDRVLCWNVRGLNRKDKQKRVRDLISLHHVKLFSLLETRVKAPKMGDMYLNLCPSWCFTSNTSCHRNGRIIVAWDAGAFTVDIIHMTSQLIHCSITPRNTYNSFFCTFVYGLNTAMEREALWSSLTELATAGGNKAWIIMGDFNAVMEMEDRIGSAVRITEIQPMRQCMNSCQLTTVKTVGRHYTWNNKQDGTDRVFTRIDRVLANYAWDSNFENAEATYLPEEEFDHCPMLLSTYKEESQRRPFRFFNMWTTSPKFTEIVADNWKKYVYGCPMFRIFQKLRWIKADLKLLNKSGFSEVEADYFKARELLTIAQSHLHADPTNNTLATNEKACADNYRKTQAVFASFMQQRAKLNWLEHGDENSKLFHQSIKQRRK
ncbi:uncharacterized protein [Spinacia oleracea]|uniref:Endonuclease/exonuclease/phosphatase domain-containing protein n=1 Tax=Spinacia oleracea TaxID=3562 RepID=A0ABM3RH67_SPIOL|nr:uncharacterized protein LOC130469600 [Spinacia oleracea]